MKFINLIVHKFHAKSLEEILLEVKWLLNYTRRYTKAILFYVALGFLSTGMGLIGSLASKYLIDAVTGYDSTNIKLIVALMIGMSLGDIVVGAATSRISTKISMNVKLEIQSEVYDRIMCIDWEAVSAFHSGDLLNRFASDVNIISDSILSWLPSLVTRLLQFLGTLLIILYYDPTMAAITLISAPVTFFMSRFLMSRMRSYNDKMRQLSSEMMSFQEESFQNLQIIKCFDLCSIFGQKLREVQQRYLGFTLDYNLFSIYTSSFLSFVGMGIGLATFGWSVFRLWSGDITYGTMTLFLQLSGSLSAAFSSLISLIPAAISATTSAGRIMAIVELPQETRFAHVNDKGDAEVNEDELELQLCNVDFSYQGRQILKDISVTVKPHTITGIIGPSGVGKTTLLHIILGLLNPGKGEVKLIHSNASEMLVSAAARKYFAYVPQGKSIFSGTIADNLRLVKPDATQEEMIAALKAACAYDFVQVLPEGIDTYIGERGYNFSDGQIQRISIARALLRNAPVLLLDEATSALDFETEQQVLKNIMQYSTSRTCILTSHKQSIIQMCDKVYQINQGKLSELVNDSLLDEVLEEEVAVAL